ncbi:MAG: hypothetical protein KC474_06150 [Cyanobacteria bacterium HKST-UBA04]|nr:hypothetical protein [Cyanobacteria bacterium HKST-UBA04]
MPVSPLDNQPLSQRPLQAGWQHGLVAPGAPRKSTQALSKANATDALAVRFGSQDLSPTLLQSMGRSSKKFLAGVFQPATENFLVGIMIIDFFAVWLPRIWNALTRGAYEYEPNKDPKLAGKTGLDRKLHEWTERAKRLNIPNGIEETWREVLSGPFLFIWPTLFFSMAKRGYGQKAVEMPVPTLRQFSQTFAAKMKSVPAHLGATPEEMKTYNRAFIDHLLSDTTTHARPMVKPTLHQSELAKHLKPTYGEFFKSWSRQLVDTLHQLDESPTAGAKKTLESLRKQFVEAVETYNRHYRPEKAFFNYDKIRVNLLDSLKSTAQRAVYKDELMGAETFFENLVQWHDFTKTAAANRGKAALKHLDWPNLIERVRRNVTTLKAGYTVSTVLITTAILIQLTKWTQSYENYEANRLMQLGGDNNNASPTADAPTSERDAATTSPPTQTRRQTRRQTERLAPHVPGAPGLPGVPGTPATRYRAPYNPLSAGPVVNGLPLLTFSVPGSTPQNRGGYAFGAGYGMAPTEWKGGYR